jgi:hypothetical protein
VQTGNFTLGTLACATCPAGSQPSLDGLDCQCRDGLVLNSTTGECSPCPGQASADAFGRTCECPAGTFDNGSADGDFCQECENGASCSTVGLNVSSVKPRQGFFRRNGTSEIVPCPYDKLCLQDGVCQPSNKGDLCLKCRDGYSRNPDYTCDFCERSFGSYLASLVGLVVLAFIGLGWLAWDTRKQALVPLTHSSILAKIFLSGFQVNSVAASLTFVWPAELLSWFSFQAAASEVNPSLLGLDCVLGTSSVHVQLVLMMFLPLIMAVLALAAHFTAHRVRLLRKKPSQWSTVWRVDLAASVVVILAFLYPTLTKVALQLFRCQGVGGGVLVLLLDADIPCSSSEYRTLVALVGVPMLLLYSVGIPVAYLVLLRRNHAGDAIVHWATDINQIEKLSAEDKRTLSKYSFLFKVRVSLF